jgi:hypothetical protein
VNLKKKTLELIVSIKSKKGFTFWDLDVDSVEKAALYCNNLSEKYSSEGLKVVRLDVEEVLRHFISIEEEQFYLNGVLLKDDFSQYYEIALEWENNKLLTPPTLIFIEDQLSHNNLPRIHIHDGKHRFCVFRQFKFSSSCFVIPISQLDLFTKHFNLQ